MQFEYIRFVNLEYIFCVIYSLLGGECAGYGKAVAGGVVDTGVNTAVSADGLPSLVTSDIAQGATSGFFQTIVDAGAFIGTVLWGAVTLLWLLFSAFSYTVSAVLFLIILASTLGLLFIRYRESSLYATLPRRSSKHPEKRRWHTLLENAMATDPRQWREGILEADDMLGELLQKLGYTGTNTSEQMRKVAEGAFVTLPAAWEAHRVRNFVAAKSSDFILTQREAFRIMKLYEQVFEEFDFI